MDLTVLGCSGSYPARRGPCSAYLVRTPGARVLLDCGNGSLANLDRHCPDAEVDAVVLTHLHPDHCADVYGLHVLYAYGTGRRGVPVYAPPGAEQILGALVSNWGDAFDWRALEDGATATVGDLALGFSRTDHPPPTFAVEAAHGPKRLVYTADTGPQWSAQAFAPGADLVVSEASYLHDDRRSPIHLSARQAGEAARAADARRLVLTHLWPQVDPTTAAGEGSDAFGRLVTLAAPHQTFVL